MLYSFELCMSEKKEERKKKERGKKKKNKIIISTFDFLHCEKD